MKVIEAERIQTGRSDQTQFVSYTLENGDKYGKVFMGKTAYSRAHTLLRKAHTSKADEALKTMVKL